MGDSLRVGCDAIMLFTCQPHNSGVKTEQNSLNRFDTFLRRPVGYDDQRLAFGIYLRTMQGMTGDDVDILRQKLLESRQFGCFAGRLPSNDSS